MWENAEFAFSDKHSAPGKGVQDELPPDTPQVEDRLHVPKQFLGFRWVVIFLDHPLDPGDPRRHPLITFGDLLLDLSNVLGSGCAWLRSCLISRA